MEEKGRDSTSHSHLSSTYTGFDETSDLGVRDVDRETGRFEDFHLEDRSVTLGDSFLVLTDDVDELDDILGVWPRLEVLHPTVGDLRELLDPRKEEREGRVEVSC